ncbi:hypothetical protein LSUE1_G009832 [Lachnellula suecica]|uniref:DUF7707 domain-containing protein n=1 Tax=Lachnellula suecica TaxID=602035 RepID=A0A8T9BXM5_9HELO|nr:hypothetical protein LSUE1_G009832 [Lachnellula suecica]
MFAKSVVAVALLASFTAAQNTTVNIPGLSTTLKSQWCNAQQTTCPELCGSATLTKTNGCDPGSLNVDCICTNGSAPGLQYYINTVATFLCEETFSECESTNAGNANAQAACKTAEESCGKLNPANYTPAASSSSSTASSTATSTGAGAAAATTGSSSTSSSKAAGATLAVARELGTGLFVVGAAAFGMMI